MSIDFQHFGKYELHKRLSRNANGEFWKGYDPELQRMVAIRVYYINQHVDPDFIAHFAQRMGILTSLHHPNIVPVLRLVSVFGLTSASTGIRFPQALR